MSKNCCFLLRNILNSSGSFININIGRLMECVSLVIINFGKFQEDCFVIFRFDALKERVEFRIHHFFSSIIAAAYY